MLLSVKKEVLKLNIKISYENFERRHRCRWKDNIKMEFQEVECEGVDWIHLAHDKV